MWRNFHPTFNKSSFPRLRPLSFRLFVIIRRRTPIHLPSNGGGGGVKGWGGGGCDSVEMTELFFLFSGHNTRGNTVPQLPSTKSLSISKIAITGIGSGLCAIVPKTNICRWILHCNFLVIPVKQFSIIRIIRSKSNNLPKRFSITITIIIYSFRLDKSRRNIVGV